MPSAQIIDLNPEGETSLQKTLSSFSNRMRQNQLEKQENDALKEIYSQYQQDGQNLERTIQAIQTRQGISPTTKVNTINQLLQFQKHNQQLQRQAVKDAEKAEKKKNEAAIAQDLQETRNLSPEKSTAYAANPSALSMVYPKEGKQNQADRAITPDQLRRIQHVESLPAFQQASIPEKSKMFRDAGVSKENNTAAINPYVEQEKLRAAEEKNKAGKDYNKLRETKIAEYVTNSLEKREEAEEAKYAIDSARKAIQGEVEGPGWKALLKNNPYSQLIMGLTPDEAALQTSNKKLLEGSKGIFGSKPTEREIFLLLNEMLPSIGKTKEANLASLYFIEKLNDLKSMHGDLVEDISKDGYVPDIESQVNQRMRPMIDEFRQELKQANKALKEIQQEQSPRIRVLGPDGKSIGSMTQKQIDEAKEKNVIFTPIK